jgi:pantetheine-phosphate adenylyltransferase
LAVYAGSFDPLTVGHLWMIEQGVALFDELVVAIGINPEKRYTYTLDDRLVMLREALRRFRNLSVTSFSNSYLIDYAQEIGATHILRGIRSGSDYEYERTMRNINGDLDPEISTVFLMPPRLIAEVSSSMVKGLIGPKGWRKVVRKYVPEPVYQHILKTHA